MPECGGPEGPRGVYGCCREDDAFVFNGIVTAAINSVRVKKPELFRNERVLDFDGYMESVVEELRLLGVCATRGGPEDEVGVKNTNDFSEQYDIHLSTGRIRYSGQTVTCKPARF